MRKNFIKFGEDWDDMALIILNTPTFNFDEFEQPYNIPTKEGEETFAFGYGINEFRKLPEEPHKVPIKLIEEENSSECAIYFYFSGAARSCLVKIGIGHDNTHSPQSTSNFPLPKCPDTVF
uniref:Uncharacterized protein n=1 Tax=Meloidogyne enterolobii TaxID=390850 RepID=A0A6V7USQ2_MELEN|nr:unnamed protein product [Meloidogyne enterolobii]